MSYGALSAKAILALNEGARRGNFFHDTGEGSISQGAKPGRGGMLPGAKVTPEIAAAGGKPVGIKLALGHPSE